MLSTASSWRPGGRQGGAAGQRLELGGGGAVALLGQFRLRLLRRQALEAGGGEGGEEAEVGLGELRIMVQGQELLGRRLLVRAQGAQGGGLASWCLSATRGEGGPGHRHAVPSRRSAPAHSPPMLAPPGRRARHRRPGPRPTTAPAHRRPRPRTAWPGAPCPPGSAPARPRSQSAFSSLADAGGGGRGSTRPERASCCCSLQAPGRCCCVRPGSPPRRPRAGPQ